MRIHYNILIILMLCGGGLYAQAPSPQVIDGSKTPELVSNFYAWKTFFEQIDHWYRRGASFYRNFVLVQLGVDQLLSVNQPVRAEFLNIIIDEASAATREEDRLRAQTESVAKMYKERHISESVANEKSIKYLEERVSWMKEHRDSFRKRVTGLDPILGPAVVAKIDQSIEIVIKPSITVSKSSDRLGVSLTDQILSKFDSK